MLRSHPEPAGQVRIVHLSAAAKPRPLPAAQLLRDLIWLLHKAEQQCQILALAVRHIVDTDRAGLDQDRPEQIRPADPSLPAANVDLDRLPWQA